MSGKTLIEWRHRLCAELSRRRYMNSDITRSTHIEIAHIFFSPDQEDSDEISSEHNSIGKKSLAQAFASFSMQFYFGFDLIDIIFRWA